MIHIIKLYNKNTLCIWSILYNCCGAVYQGQMAEYCCKQLGIYFWFKRPFVLIPWDAKLSYNTRCKAAYVLLCNVLTMKYSLRNNIRRQPCIILQIAYSLGFHTSITNIFSRSSGQLFNQLFFFFPFCDKLCFPEDPVYPYFSTF